MSYNGIASRAEEFVPDVKEKKFDGLVIILRGGSFAGMHLSFLTELPVYFVEYHRPTRMVSWKGNPPPLQSSILVVEDFAGSGTTLQDTLTFLEPAYTVSTFVVCKDKLSRLQDPTYCCFELDSEEKRFIVPWEKHEYENNE
ncbi:phosphoribosyltransferase family protein [Bacillus coahuilensis]|uniref:phosphoribosyltransferase family protein n=1 Tax=Bacillus coahuilensis TaxID=408580 RepID=UPI00049438FD|nr:phosphoribosyltransferase family protein [Bacillus coahuilensis]